MRPYSLARVVLLISLLSSLTWGTNSSPTPEIRSGIWRGRPVTYVMVRGRAIYQGDILLEKVEPVNPLSLQGHGAIGYSFGIGYSAFLWPKNAGTGVFEIPYTINAASDPNATPKIQAAITSFNATFSGLIQWVARTTQPDWVDFNLSAADLSGTCHSFVADAHIGPQGLTGSTNCTAAGMLHEMGHATGLYHEQSRPDRDTYGTVNYNNIIKNARFNFDIIQDDAQNITSFYDYGSVMQYFSNNFTRNGGVVFETIPAGIPLSNTVGYTPADVEGIKRLYGAPPTAITVTTNPPGLPIIVDGTTYAAPQTFNWTLNSSHTLNVPSGVQSLPNVVIGTFNGNPVTATEYFIYGRWNDSITQSHTITVSAGNGFLPFPANAPMVSTYTANYIQLVPYQTQVSPVNAGTVQVSPLPQTYSGSALQFFTARQPVTLTATPNSGWNFYSFNNAPFWLDGGLSANPKTFIAPDWGNPINTTVYFTNTPVFTFDAGPETSTSNLGVQVDGGWWYTPKKFSSFYDGSAWAAGQSTTPHTLNFPGPEQPYSFYTRYAFSNWNLNGSTNTNASVTLNSLPSSSASYVANVTPQFLPSSNWGAGPPAFMPCGTTTLPTISPASPTGDGFYPAGQILTFATTPASPWTFAGWTYDLSGTVNPQNLTVNDEVLVYGNFNTTTTPLTITSISPISAIAGSPNFTLTVNGTGFTSSTQLILIANPGPNATQFFPATTLVSSTKITATITSAMIANAGGMQIWLNVYPTGWTGNCSVYAYQTFLVANNPNPGTPVITATPASLTFTSQVIGSTSASKAVTLKNTGTGATPVAITASGNFAESDNCNSNLAAGASCTVNVTFTPSISGAVTGSLTISDNASNSPQLVALAGTGAYPVTFAPTSLAYGTATVGTTTAAKVVTISNNQSVGLSLALSASPNYAISTTTCGASLAAKAKCTASVTFTPSANGAINGTLALTHNAFGSPQVVGLSGTGSGGGTSPFTFTPATLSFTGQVPGSTSAAKTVTVKNVSGASLTISSPLAISGNFAFSSNTCAGAVLAANATCTVGVTFRPTVKGAVKGAVTVDSNAAVHPQTLNLSGTAVLPVTFAPASLTFAAQTVGTTSAPQTVTLTNNQSTALGVTSIVASGDFAVTHNCPASLAGKAKCTLNVTFTPSATGTIKGVVTVTNNGTGSPEDLKLTGTGQ